MAIKKWKPTLLLASPYYAMPSPYSFTEQWILHLNQPQGLFWRFYIARLDNRISSNVQNRGALPNLNQEYEYKLANNGVM